ncbi:SLIT-ROBO Rho GTPase-activating protein 1 isoform X2 [Nilaparvata lugens]|uniref:SLIT-ROBO Rho GTPase-activating protein 1 isoform X1 n=1 Tax=Nilaparvata lugens TaxID=108931 RepID=UPI00193CDB42|nr:SLIT-ROBO Rho GTPase-activating protein 1 isoform X1 [Nilaparvata lugens]XP_039277866.1 SLIT-ROBO Rho GTPase-activating protein 1 isoform X2 [Nilaparvata lugens]
MFQCIIQQRNGWNRNSPELKDVYPDIRLQLNEQLRCLDVRMETQVAVVGELQDFFRRRAEVELDYSKNLDKLAKSLQLRHKEQKQKREQWPLFSSYSCWQQLVTQTRNLSKDHAALSEVYSTHLVSRLAQVIEDVQRIYRRCREIGYETHEEILRVLHELHTTMKTYQAYQGECRQAEAKLRLAENQRLKIEQSLPKEKLDRSKKFRLVEKEVQKRKNKYFDAKLKALKARNEYVLCLEASNTTLHKYFVDDLSDLIDCMDLGFHECISRALMMHISAEEGHQGSVQAGLDALHSNIAALDSRLDKQRFLEFNHSAFMIPKKFEFQGKTDEFAEPELQKLLCAEMETRLVQLKTRLTTLRAESEEVWKTLETAEATLLDMLTAKDYDCSGYFGDNALPASKPPETVSIKLRADRHETEEFYLTKLREFMLGTSRIARLDSKHEYIRQQLLDMSSGVEVIGGSGGIGGGSQSPGLLQPSSASKPPRRKRIGRLHMNGQPKLFGGSLEEYLESLNQEIPLIVKSCIRVINLYGLHHQGIFRVSGSQVEINNFREAFERGEDPLADVTDASDINSVAGVLKLYLRELREPLFPIIYFEQFMELAQLESKQEFVMRMKDLVQSLPRCVVIVMRYLFAFLNHLSEYSDENMMDPYNLAICFGPTLVPVPEDKDQVQYQNQVNELIKNIILFNDEIFPLNDFGGTVYEKYISREPDDNDVGDSPSDHVQEDMDSEVYPSEDETESLEATAQFDFIARSERELSLRKGEHVTLYSQVSNDWWRGSVNGKEGLIPDKYILLKMKDEDREKMELFKSSSSDESMRRRASSSNDSVLSGASSSHSPLLGATPPWPPILPPSHHSASVASTVATQEVMGEQLLVKDATSEDTLNKGPSRAMSCNSLDSGKESASDEQLLRGDESLDNSIHTSLGSVEEFAAGQRTVVDMEKKKTHWKSQSVGEVGNGVSEAPTNFSQNRELWQRRAASQTHLQHQHLQVHGSQKEGEPEVTHKDIPLPVFQQAATDESAAGRDLRQTPDLVMDLPLVSGTPDSTAAEKTGAESPTGPESPDMTTAAERFAKQNQCTLKKNTKQKDSKPEQTPPPLQPKPPLLKAKPQLMRKPVLPHPSAQVSPQLIRRDTTNS